MAKKKAEEEVPDALTTRLVTLHAEERAKRAAQLAREVVKLGELKTEAKEKRRQLANVVKDQELLVARLAREVKTGTEQVDAQREMFDDKG